MNITESSDSIAHSYTRKPYYRNGTTLFLSFFKRQPGKLSLAIFAFALTSISALIPAILVGMAIDELTNFGFDSTVWLYSGLIVLSGVFYYVVSYFSLYTYITLAFSYERDIRQEYFDRIQQHSLTFHDENNSSKLLSLGVTEITQMRQGIMPGTRFIIQNIFSIIFITYSIYRVTDISKLYITFGGFALYYIVAIYQSKKIIPVRTQLANTVGELTEESQEIFKGIEVVRSLGSRLREIQRFRTTSKRYSKLGIQEGQMASFYWPDLILLSLTAVLFWLTLLDVTNKVISVGDMVQVLGLLLTLQLSSSFMPQIFLSINAALTNSNRIWKKMNWQDPQPDKMITKDLEVNWDGDLKFEDVTFTYTQSERPALEEINISIPPHSKVALIGGPGSGKSTFLKLLLQLYLPQKGRITISGVDFQDIKVDEVRRNVSRVEQEVFLFSGTIRDNIAFAKPDASDEDVIAAAQAAQALEFIKQLPDGIYTKIGERGVDISGGQKQRLAIARAILADPKILLLDDSASALDSKTEELLRIALDNLSKDRTTITVTQRLNTLVRADLIILLKKGKVLASGTHKELLKDCEEYQNIFKLLPESEQLLAQEGD